MADVSCISYRQFIEENVVQDCSPFTCFMVLGQIINSGSRGSKILGRVCVVYLHSEKKGYQTLPLRHYFYKWALFFSMGTFISWIIMFMKKNYIIDSQIVLIGVLYPFLNVAILSIKVLWKSGIEWSPHGLFRPQHPWLMVGVLNQPHCSYVHVFWGHILDYP